MNYQTAGPKDIGAVPCIMREYLGGAEMISLDAFCDDVIQDDELALEIAGEMLSTKKPYLYNDDGPEAEAVERFAIANETALQQAVSVALA